jgi:ribosomal protein S18 acetylase RimI-like enzyme
LILVGGGAPRGLVAGAHDNDRRSVHLMAMWVHPTLRGSGAADALVTALADWAAAEGATEITLCVEKGNDRARRCYERNGFRATGVETAGDRPGFLEVGMVRPVAG